MKLEFSDDAKLWLSKWSTWLASISAAATAGMLAYSQLPERIQSAFPDSVLMGLGSVAIVCAMLVPVATGLKQKNLP